MKAPTRRAEFAPLSGHNRGMKDEWTQDEIEALADPRSFQRGSGYQRGGRVEITKRSAGRVDAIVRGTMPYSVELRRDPRMWSCNCPVGAASFPMPRRVRGHAVFDVNDALAESIGKSQSMRSRRSSLASSVYRSTPYAPSSQWAAHSKPPPCSKTVASALRSDRSSGSAIERCAVAALHRRAARR